MLGEEGLLVWALVFRALIAGLLIMRDSCKGIVKGNFSFTGNVSGAFYGKLFI